MISDMRKRLTDSGYFGLHNPADPSKWVQIKTEDLPSDERGCRVRITVDENDPLSDVVISSVGPVNAEFVRRHIRMPRVLNPVLLAQEFLRMTRYYSKRGWLVEFQGQENPSDVPGDILKVDTHIGTVSAIQIRAAAEVQTDIRRRLLTKPGSYFNSRNWQADLRRLESRWHVHTGDVQVDSVWIENIRIVINVPNGT